MGDEKSVEELLAELAKSVKLGDLVLYTSNNPLEEGLLTRAAIVTKTSINGAVSLTVFNEGHEQYFTKIPLALKAQAGYYTIRA